MPTQTPQTDELMRASTGRSIGGLVDALEDHARTLERALTAAESRASRAEKDAERESGWLIEHGELPGPVYFCGWRNGNIYLPVWDADHIKAVRFSRMQDAGAVASAIDEPRKIVEHVWLAKRQKHPPSTPLAERSGDVYQGWSIEAA